MENSALSNCVRRTIFSNQQRTIQEGVEEESSWTMYFGTEDGLGHYEDSSMISDAASPIALSFEEDTASSPSNRIKGYGVKEDNAIEGKTMINTKTKEKGLNKNGIMNEEYCAELKKRGLCLVPLSMLSNYIA